MLSMHEKWSCDIMNLPTKITISRIVLAFVILFLLCFPWTDVGVVFPTFFVQGKILVDTKYIIAGILFVVASVTDFLDGYFARHAKKVSDAGAVLDYMADKILVDGVLIVLAYQGFVSLLVPVFVVTRDLFLDGLRLLAFQNHQVIEVGKIGKIKTFCMILGVSLVFFYNLPFELWGIYVAEIFVDVATILSILSAVFYFIEWKGKTKVEELEI